MVTSPEPDSAAGTSSPPSALLKGLAVMEALVVHDRLSDVAASTGLSHSTVHRILADLSQGGWVFQDDERRYRPGRRMNALAGMLAQDREIADQAAPHLTALRRATGMTVHLGLVKQDEVMYVSKLDGEGSYRMTSRVGGLVPMYSTAIGKSYLATLDDGQVEEIVARTGLRPICSGTHRTVSSLLEDLDRTRARGWAIDDGENEERLRCVGAVIHDATGRAIGGVSVSALEFEMTPERMRPTAQHVLRAARGVTASLGGPLLDA